MIELQSHFSSKSQKSSFTGDLGTVHRKDRIRKKVNQRKQKLSQDQDENSNSGRPHLSKEERLHRQKLKNRESAQRSRDQRKTYITHLQNQISCLRADRDRILVDLDNLSKSKLCPRCQSPSSVNTCSPLSQHMLSDEFQSSSLMVNSSPDEASYERIVGESQNKLPMFLFVCFVILGVFMSSGTAIHTDSQSMVPEMLFDVEHVSKALVPAYQDPIKQSCLVEYLKMREPGGGKLPLPGNLRSPYEVRHNNDVLVCHNPELVRYNTSQNMFSNQMEILMRGRELNVTDNMTQSVGMPTPDLNDLYMVLVEVKGISRYSGMNCLA